MKLYSTAAITQLQAFTKFHDEAANPLVNRSPRSPRIEYQDSMHWNVRVVMPTLSALVIAGDAVVCHNDNFRCCQQFRYYANSSFSAVAITLPFAEWIQRTHDVMITSLLRQNDVAVSFWRYNDVFITLCVHWELLTLSLQHKWVTTPGALCWSLRRVWGLPWPGSGKRPMPRSGSGRKTAWDFTS